MKIALISPNYQAVSETWIWRQVNYLKPYLSVIGTFQPVIDNHYKQIPVYNLRKPNLGIYTQIINKIKKKQNYFRQIQINLKHIQKKHPFDIIYIHYLTTAYQLKDYIQKTTDRVFVHCHGYDVTWNMKDLEYPFNNIYNQDYINFAKNIQNKITYIANSKNTIRKLTSIGIEENNIKLLYFGVENFCNLPTKFNKNSPIKILFLGRLVDCKGPHKTIEAFEKACEMGINGELTLAGDGPLMTTCRILINKSKYKEKIKLIGPVSSFVAKNLLEQSHIFTAHNMTGELTNQIEAYGLTFLEAMAAGLPVITGNSGGITETVIENVTGYFFTQGNVDKQAELLYKLSLNENTRYQMGINAINHIKNNFTLEKEREDLFKIIESVY